MSDEAPEEVLGLARRRAEARVAADFERADELRRRILEMGWRVRDDRGGGWSLEPAATQDPTREHDDAPTGLEEPATADVSLQWVCEGWPDDVDRAIASFRGSVERLDAQYVVVDVTGENARRWGGDVEVVSVDPTSGWARARNAGLRRARGRTVLALDPSVEADGDVLGPLAGALADTTVGVCGPFGIVTKDLREFAPAPGPGDCDAI